MMKNIHITLAEFRNESRMLKEVTSLEASGIFNEFIVIALGADDLIARETISSKARVERIHLHSRGLPKSAPFQLLKFTEFLLKCFFLVKREKPQVVNVHTLALLPLGWLMKKILKVKLVYDAHELETERNGWSELRKRVGKWVERVFIKHVDLVIVVSESIASWYAREYDIQRPLVVLNAPKKRALKSNNYFRERLGIREEQTILLYQGGLMKGRGVRLILDAFKKRQRDSVVLVFMGYGDLEADIKLAARDNENIYFHPAVSPSIVLEYTASADMGVSLIENTCLSYYYCMPNKLFEYAMAGLPVLVSNMKDMSKLVRENHMGTVIKDFSVSGINQAIDNIMRQDLTSMKKNAYRVACENAWETQEEKMLVAYDALLNEASL